MRASRHNLCLVFVHVCCFVLLFCVTLSHVVADRKMEANRHATASGSNEQLGSGDSSLGRNVRSSQKHRNAYHRPLTEEQKLDQNLQFMLNLYKSAAEPDGRPKQHRKFGSNTVRMLRPSASSVHSLSLSTDHRHTFSVEYELQHLSLDQLIRVSLVHLRSPTTATTTTQTPRPPPPHPRCRARVTSLGLESQRSPLSGALLTLEPLEPWTETDITAHFSGRVRGRANGSRRLALSAQYWCSQPPAARHQARRSSPSRSRLTGRRVGGGGGRWWRREGGGRGGRREAPSDHLNAPSLLLYLEEEAAPWSWAGASLGGGGGGGTGGAPLSAPRPPPPRRRRRQAPDPTDLPNDTSPEERDAAPKPRPAKDDPLPPSSSSYDDLLLKRPASDPAQPPSSSSIIGALPSDLRPGYKHKSGPPRDPCGLHSVRLTFRQLGLQKYFVAPYYYDPRYCQGDCPRVLRYGYHATNHAVVQNLISDLGLGDVPAPSCVPYLYKPMSVVVWYQEMLVYRELEDMVAESCMCR